MYIRGDRFYNATSGIFMTLRTSVEFDRAYRAPLTPWGDVRIPAEIAELVSSGVPRSALELGCGVGRFSRYVAQRGLRSVGVDFSPVAIAKAHARVARDEVRPAFVVGDVTDLGGVQGPFDVSFDVGCFHCLAAGQQPRYVAEVFRLLAPGGTHLIWALDGSPAGEQLSPRVLEQIFTPQFRLSRAARSRRRIVRSHWYWLVRAEPSFVASKYIACNPSSTEEH
jgi:SAM-dependent methyltransferase